ncbi:MAG: TRAP transporter substrate-binding protein [Mogibacterium sp.]|nr:TRAP transporter substrate-binding protein [Mogibacterium sp.]
MKRRMKAAALLLAALMVLSMMLTACSSQTESSVEYVIRLGHSDTEDNLLNVSLQDYAEWVNEQTEGRVVIRIYPNEQLGDNSEMAQQLITGELDAMMMPQGVEAKYAPKIATLGLPFLFTSYEQAWKVMDDETIAAGLTEGLEGYNLIQLAFWENGMRQLTNSVREVRTPEDVAGLKLRIPDDDMTAAIFRELGASTTVFAWSRTYDALEQGTFDGQENPIANISANKINEVNTYMTITNHKYESKNLVFSLSTWKKLPPDIQEILLEGAKKFGQEHREAVASEESEQFEKLKASGMVVNESPDIEAFKVATRNVYTQFEMNNAWTADLVARIRAAAAKAD